MLSIAPEKVCFVVIKARAFDVKVDVIEPDPGSNPADDDMREVLEDYEDDPTFDELKDFIGSLNVDEQIDLVALTWLGRGDGTKDEWSDLVQQAKDSRSDHTAEYLLGIPLLGDYLEEALSQLGFFCDEEEIGHL
ncbi:MAG: DUF3775 domain-containing protein [Rhodospirillales bacterium]|nr:DUF3775 domain-containing protein [Rhodospirillales bacterium]MDH3909896.1 DUF3775 domain-containing protein [Rhodospirillales bacterium]MDH3967069.1 DUF3775 domain-containing protein [Rhodospirillales bacterium]